jgi:hypothetical protein
VDGSLPLDFFCFCLSPYLFFQESPLAEGNPLRRFALPLILTGVLLFSLSSSRKVLIEGLALGSIFSGLFSLSAFLGRILPG